MSEILYRQDANKKRKFNDKELEQYELDKVENGRIEAEQQAKEAARESAMAKLKALGLTDDEISALVP